MPMSFIMSRKVEHLSEKTPREFMEMLTNLTHLKSVQSLIKFFLLVLEHRTYINTWNILEKEDLDGKCHQL